MPLAVSEPLSSLSSQPCATLATFSCSMITSCNRNCHMLISAARFALIWKDLCAVTISSTRSPRSSSRLRLCARRAWISPAYTGGESFSNSMLRLESSLNAKGSHSPLGILMRISDSSTTVTGRRQIDKRSDLEPRMTMCVTSSMVEQMTPSTARIMSPCTSVPSRSAGPPVVMAPTVTSPSHKSTATPSVPPARSRSITTSKSSSLDTRVERALSMDAVPSPTEGGCSAASKSGT
mmetsp:Transcript_28541/g.66869  ORF Transcript_28541/g.66869 Transcript_28541/m.66869 type:complete len:236 (-) Transcript_28541:1767-2474(-)